jgi:hypothetical protein
MIVAGRALQDPKTAERFSRKRERQARAPPRPRPT